MAYSWPEHVPVSAELVSDIVGLDWKLFCDIDVTRNRMNNIKIAITLQMSPLPSTHASGPFFSVGVQYLFYIIIISFLRHCIILHFIVLHFTKTHEFLFCMQVFVM